MGLILRQQGLILLEHPLLADALRDRAAKSEGAIQAHRELARAWNRIGHDPQAQVNEARHLLAANEFDRALSSLNATMPRLVSGANVDEVVAAAELLLEVSESLLFTAACSIGSES